MFCIRESVPESSIQQNDKPTHKTISPDNHCFLKKERHLRTISEMTTIQLTATHQMWTDYLQLCPYVYNNFARPASTGLNPFQLIFGRFIRNGRQPSGRYRLILQGVL